jgi:hypothetical protein
VPTAISGSEGWKGDIVDGESRGVERGDAPSGSHVIETQPVSEGMAVVEGARDRHERPATSEHPPRASDLGEGVAAEFALADEVESARGVGRRAQGGQYARTRDAS